MRKTIIYVLVGTMALFTALYLNSTRRQSAYAVGRSPGEPQEVETNSMQPVQTMAAYRREISKALVEGDVEDAVSPRPFDEVYGELVLIFVHVRGLHAEDRNALASEFGKKVSPLFKEITDIEGAASLAIAKLDALPFDWEGLEVGSEVAVSRMVIDFDFQRHGESMEGRPAISLAVSALLGRLPNSMVYCDLVTVLLVDQPYLGPEHEPLLLELVNRASGDLAYMAHPLQSLLATLWQSLDEEGLELAGSWMTYLDSDNEVLARAATQGLLLSEANRDIGIEHLIETGNPVLIGEMAQLVARALPPGDALRAIKEMRVGSKYTSLTAPYGLLAGRDADVLMRGYREALLEEGSVSHREDIAAALGNYTGPRGPEFARQVFASDPSPRVRAVALLALTEQGDFPEMYRQAISDEGFLAPELVGMMVVILKRYAPNADPEFLSNAIAQLQGLRGVSEQVQGKLAELMAAYGL